MSRYGSIALAGLAGLAGLLAAGCQEPKTGMWEGAAVPAAREAARDLGPGQMMRVPFTAEGVAFLVGLDGASYVVRLPESAPASNPAYFAIQAYQNGRPLGPVSFEEDLYVPAYREPCRTWLVDAAGWGDPFPPPDVTPAAVVAVQLVGLEGRGHVAFRRRIDASPAPAGKPAPRFHFIGSLVARTEIAAGQAVPVGCWFQTDPKVRFDKGIPGVAASSPRAYVIYIRLGRDASTPPPASAPASARVGG